MLSDILHDFDIDVDVWEAHSQLKIILREEYEQEMPSKVLWALILDTHPKSDFAELEPVERRNLISQDYLQDDKFTWEAYKDTIAKLKKTLLTRVERLLKNWEDKLEERDAFIHHTPYNAETMDMLEKAMKETYKMWDNYDKVIKAFQKQEEDTSLGGAQESLAERGLL